MKASTQSWMESVDWGPEKLAWEFWGFMEQFAIRRHIKQHTLRHEKLAKNKLNIGEGVFWNRIVINPWCTRNYCARGIHLYLTIKKENLRGERREGECRRAGRSGKTDGD